MWQNIIKEQQHNYSIRFKNPISDTFDLKESFIASRVLMAKIMPLNAVRPVHMKAILLLQFSAN